MFRDRTFTGNTGTLTWAPGAASRRAGRSAHRLTVRGAAGAVLWGHRTAAQLGAWMITKQEQPHQAPVWHLAARVTQADAFQCRQKPLTFTAFRDKGLWCWGVESLDLVGDQLHAVLGPPEQ
jgi:hypothetical protein